MKLGTAIIQEQSFIETCLPETIEMAKAHKNIVLKYIAAYPKEWSFPDKVLAWLSPELYNDIANYYDSDGQPMEKIFQEHQIAHLDASFCRILKSRIEKR